MAKKDIFLIIPVFSTVILGMSLFYGCGTPGQLTGGPRDSIAPKVIKMIPENLQTNFDRQKITIEFDEYFKIDNQAKEFSISPETEIMPELKIKKKILEITFQDTLEKNTTYTLNFGKAIADINESNYIKNFTYVFATGPKLDSLSISGKVINSTTGLPEMETLVMIVPLDRDTIFGKKKASIYTTTDSSGNYSLKNLRKDTYKIYAIKEQSGDKIYQQATDEVGFIKTPVELSENRSNVNLKTFKEDAVLFRVVDRKFNDDGSLFMRLNKQLRKPEIKIIDPENIDKEKLFKFNSTNDSLKIWLNNLEFDSTKVVILDEGKALDTVKFTRGKKDTYKRTMIAADNLQGNTLNPNRPLKLTFNLPVENIDVSKITLTQDSVARKGFTVEKDSTDLLSYFVKYPWVARKKYEINFAPGAVTGIFKATHKEFKKNFELGSKDDYGTLQLKVMVPVANKQYILQVIDESKNLVSSSTFQNDTTVRFNNYRAGIYYVRMIYDNNKNGKWDTGNVKEGLQPENIYNEPKELSIKANWDRNETITIPKEPDAI